MSRVLSATFAGSERRRARAHGELCAARIKETRIVDYYRGYVKRFLPPSIFANGFVELLHAGFARRLSPEGDERLSGFAEAIGISAEEAKRGYVMPDVLNALAGMSGGKAKLPALGCTSVAAWGPYTRDGRFLYGRNLDFCGVGIFDRYPMVARHRPDKGVPYVSFASAGAVADGVTGINEEGLTVALHQHYTTDVVLLLAKTRPVLDLAAEVLRTCRTIDEAAELCAGRATTSGWTLVLTSWREKRACAIERAGTRYSRRDYGEGLCVRTNGYETETLRAREFPYPAMRASSASRAKAARALAEARRGALDPRAMAAILGERNVENGELVFSQGIAQPNNLTSVVFDPEKGEAWFAEGIAPVNGGVFRRVPLWDDSVGDETIEIALPAARRDAEHAYNRAYNAWESGAGETGTLPHLDAAAAAAPRDAYVRVIRGFLRLRAGEHGAAAEDLALAAELPDIDHRRAAALLWLARARDAQGRREDALSAYGRAKDLGGEDARLAASAEQGLAEPYDLRRAARVLPDFNLGETYAY